MAYPIKLYFSLSLVLGLFLCSESFGQGNRAWQKYRHEVSIGYGFNNYLSAIGENDKIGIPFMLQRSTFNASYRYFVLKHVAVRGSFTHAYSRKNDKENTDTARSLPIDYAATLTEFAVMGEYHVFDETVRGRSGRVRRARGGMGRTAKIGLSFFGGVALDYKRFYGEYLGNLVELKPYNAMAGTTLPSDYKSTHVHFPLGTQLRLVLTENWRLGIEAGYRFGLADYVDNVSSVYYVDGNPFPERSEYADPSYVGQDVTFAKDGVINASATSDSGKRDYFFAMLTLSYRIKL